MLDTRRCGCPERSSVVERDDAFVRPDAERVAQLEQRRRRHRLDGVGDRRASQVTALHRLQYEVVDQQRHLAVSVGDHDVDVRPAIELAKVCPHGDVSLEWRIRENASIPHRRIQRVFVVRSQADGHRGGQVERGGMREPLSGFAIGQRLEPDLRDRVGVVAALCIHWLASGDRATRCREGRSMNESVGSSGREAVGRAPSTAVSGSASSTQPSLDACHSRPLPVSVSTRTYRGDMLGCVDADA